MDTGGDTKNHVIEISAEQVLAMAPKKDTDVYAVAQISEAIVGGEDAITLAHFFKAFSDGTRLRILHALSIREMNVGELCELLEASQPAVSNHLRVLSQQRIVKGVRTGRNVYYSLDDWHINAIIGMAIEHYNMDCPQDVR